MLKLKSNIWNFFKINEQNQKLIVSCVHHKRHK